MPLEKKKPRSRSASAGATPLKKKKTGKATRTPTPPRGRAPERAASSAGSSPTEPAREAVSVGEQMGRRSSRRIPVVQARAKGPDIALHALDKAKDWAAVSSLQLPGRWAAAGVPRIHKAQTALNDGNLLRCRLTVILRARTGVGDRFPVLVNRNRPFIVSQQAMQAVDAHGANVTRREVWHSERLLIDDGHLHTAFEEAVAEAARRRRTVDRVVIEIHQTNSPCAGCQPRLKEVTAQLREKYPFPVLVRASAEQRFDKAPGPLGAALQAVDLRFQYRIPGTPATAGGRAHAGQVGERQLAGLTGVHLRIGGKFEMDAPPAATTGEVQRGRSAPAAPPPASTGEVTRGTSPRSSRTPAPAAQSDLGRERPTSQKRVATSAQQATALKKQRGRELVGM